MEKLNIFDFQINQVGYITECVEPISGHLTLKDTIQYFESNPDIGAIPVELGQGYGVISRSDVLQKRGPLSNTGKPLSSLDSMNQQFSSFNSHENIKKVLRDSSEYKGQQFFIIYKESSLFGVVSLNNIIRHISDIQDEEIRKGREFQQFLLDRNLIKDSDFELISHLQRSHDLGKDYYYCSSISNDISMISCFDVQGGNQTASLVSVMIDAFFKTRKELTSLDLGDVEKLMLSLNSFLFHHTPEDFQVRSLFVFIHKIEKKVKIYNFGYTTPFLILLEEGKIKAKMPAPPFEAMGMKDLVIFRETPQVFEMKNLRHIFLYSEGLASCVNSFGESFGMDRIKEALVNNYKSLGSDFSSILEEKVNHFRKDTPLLDDITTLIVNF
ncbi:SpoIIE family protein phosphatase [Oceanispirochaeta sp.]|jgi:serine phosphatase RsbU (regulator of sigma subunit)|uniref:PP2C family protein-serine/threonine phosphatase n=1 Tax=Oceanispirochaeta sp. TaxID=2035350 RepID=UPI002603BBA3|nr:SpoIIE family protein phosphatase [Oceanispirochaeta sp.]MDA3956210.1 SpoIIE family protein phosphatase [Oceanispirochaeta sp.]